MRKLLLNASEEKNTKIPNNNNGFEYATSYSFKGIKRGEAAIEHEIKPDHIYEFELEDETLWICDHKNLDTLFPEIYIQEESTFQIPEYIEYNDSSDRGFLKKIAIKVLNVFIKKTIENTVESLARKLEMNQLNTEVGLFSINKNFDLKPIQITNNNRPFLLFLHGTASSTIGSFGDLKNTVAWENLYNFYQGNIFAFQHESLTKSALENTEDLLSLLPNGIELHVISQSRGGLIGEILCRYSNDPRGILGFSEEAKMKLKKENRTKDVDSIKNLETIISNKNFTVSKFIRVACPAAGTSLAAERLNVYLNTILNLLSRLSGFGTIGFELFKGLIMQVLKTKDDPNILPGIECMNPNSIFINILNSELPIDKLDKPLIVISGNRKVSLGLKGLVAILSKVYFRRRNDFVVDTDSMYMGSKRPTQIQYFFNENADLNHFKYFENAEIQSALFNAIVSKEGERIPGFKLSAQNLVPSSDRADSLGLEYGDLYGDEPKGNKPILVLLPGIMGSNLKKGENKIWIAYLRMIAGELSELDINTQGIEASSLISTSYKKIKSYFSETYDVVTFPYDWRLPLDDTCTTLNTKFEVLLNLNQPIKVIAHSMGGVLMRDFILKHDSTWTKLNASEGFKVVFLGVPFMGSYRIPFVLMGQDGLINKLSTIDFTNSKKGLLNIFTKFKGILNLLPITPADGSKDDFAILKNWENLRESIGEPDWPLPSQQDLTYFDNYRKNILAKFQNIDFKNAIYLAGKDEKTPYGYRIEEWPETDGEISKKLVLIYTNQGDASVTWEHNIPKSLTLADKVYIQDITHGELANVTKIFEGIGDLLIFGATQELQKKRSENNDIQRIFASKPDYDFDKSEKGFYNAILGLNSPDFIKEDAPILNVSVSNGDLSYSNFPLMAGHFLNDSILFAEKVIDNKLNNALTTRNQLGIHVGLIGQSVVILSEKSDFQGTIVLGLGKLGGLTGTELSKTVEMGVCNFLIETQNRYPEKKKIGISTLLIGCSYGGLTVENAAISILEGISNANKKIKKLIENSAIIEDVEFVERYEDRALSCLYALSRRINQKNDDAHFYTLTSNKLNIKLGSKRRINIENSEDWWERVTVRFEDNSENNDGFRKLLFNVTTGGAREEQGSVFVNVPFINEFIKVISLENNWNVADKRVIFESIIPNEFKDFLKKKRNIVWVVDKETAFLPWELLSDNSKESKPFCINAGMIRQLATTDYRANSDIVTNNKALIIADPPLNGFKKLSQLPGALKEGRSVLKILNENEIQVNDKIGASGIDIQRALKSDDYKIIHMAGHGIFEESANFNMGMVIGENQYLSPIDINQMSTVPELVFVNCCYLGLINNEAESLFRTRYKMAANIGTQLIDNGVKAVIVAAWAVNDDAALEFSEIFYQKMFEGYNFATATRLAREALFSEYEYANNTWGAYQCYGDPFYKLNSHLGTPVKFEYNFSISEEGENELENLYNILESKEDPKKVLKYLEAIISSLKKNNLENARILEKEALIYSELDYNEKAIEIYEELLKTEKADFSVSALENYSNIRIKNVINKYKENLIQSTDAIAEILQITEGLRNLLIISKTSERYCLIGSAYKRLGLIATGEDKLNYYKNAAENYLIGYKIASKDLNSYALNNYLIINLLLNQDFPIEINLKEIGEELEHKIIENQSNFEYIPNKFLISVGDLKLTNLIISENKFKNESEWKKMIEGYKKTWAFVGSPRKISIAKENFEILEDIITATLSQKPKDKSCVLKLKIIRQNLKILRNMS